MKAGTVAIAFTNNDFGKGGRDEMQKALAAQGIKVVADVSTDPGQVDFVRPSCCRSSRPIRTCCSPT